MAKMTVRPRQQDALLGYLEQDGSTSPVATTPGPGGRLPSAQPVAGLGSNSGASQVRQLPTGRGEQIGSLAASAGSEAGRQIMSNVGRQAAQSAGTSAATSAGASALSGIGSMGITMGTDYLGGKLKPKEEMPTYGGEFGQYTDQFGRRFEGAGPGVAGGAVRGAGYGTTVMPGIGTAIGAGVGALIGAATRNATSAYSDFAKEDAAKAIQDIYQKELGRPASDEEVVAHLVGQGLNPGRGDRWVGEKGLFNVLGAIRNSPEAAAFKSGGSTAAADGLQKLPSTGKQEADPVATLPGSGATRPSDLVRDAAGTGMGAGLAAGGVTDAAAPAAAGGAPRGLGQFANKLEGFDAGKLNSDHDTPKYQVARVLSNYPPTPEGLQQALGELNALGIGTFSIGGSKGDKLSVSGSVDPRFEGITTFDVIRGAGNGGEAWQWAPEGGGGAAAAGGAAGASDAAKGTLGGLVGQPGGNLNAIMQALQMLAQGQNEPASLQQSLLKQFA